MPISIQFDSIEELRQFLSGQSGDNAHVAVSKKVHTDTDALTLVPEVQTETTEKTEKMVSEQITQKQAPETKTATPPGRPGRKPKTPIPPIQQKAEVAQNKESESTSRPLGRSRLAGSLTEKIQRTIKKFVHHRTPFTATSIYDDLARRDKSVNKQSVITCVLRQMRTTFVSIPMEERQGNGPRPVNVYLP